VGADRQVGVAERVRQRQRAGRDHGGDDARRRQRRVELHRADAAWTNRAYYTYTVKVLSRWANNTLVTNTVTDPYSLSLNANSTRSFVANLDSPALKPAGWDDQRIPKLDAPTDIALYELHIRDFSPRTARCRPPTAASTWPSPTEANPMRHLKSLQKAA
jgi:pullulanase